MLSKRRVTITQDTTTTVVKLVARGPSPCPVCGHRPNDEATARGAASAETGPLWNEVDEPTLDTSALNGIRAELKAGEKVDQEIV